MDLNFQMIKYLMKRKCFVLVQKVNVIGKEEIRFFGLEEIAKIWSCGRIKSSKKILGRK